MTNHRALFESLGSAATDLGKALVAGASVQWHPGASLNPVSEGKSQGTVSNPTLAIVADPRRLKLRAAVAEAELLIERTQRDMRAATAALVEAIDEHGATTV